MCEQDVAPESVAREHLQQLLKQLCDLGMAPASQRRMISAVEPHFQKSPTWKPHSFSWTIRSEWRGRSLPWTT